MTYQAYPVYRESGVARIGEVPADWQAVALKRLVSMQSGESITSDSITPEGAFPVFGASGLRGYTNAFTHDGNFILIGRQGTCGKINYGNGKFWASEHAIVVTPEKNINIRWLGYLLEDMNLSQYSMSAAQPGLSVETVSNLAISVPSLTEQNAIAVFLDWECGRIDSLIAEQEHLIALLQEKRRKVINQMVTYKPDGSPWPLVSARWICRFESGMHLQPDDLSFDPVGNLYIRTHEFGGFQRNKDALYVPVRPTDAIVLRPEDGVICFDGFINSKGTGTIGLVRWGFEGILGPSLHRINAINGVESRFPKYALSTEVAHQFILSSARGATAQHAGHAANDIPVPMPPLAVQTHICDALDLECSRIDALTTEADEMISLLRERRSALISAAVTGQIDVRNQPDPP